MRVLGDVDTDIAGKSTYIEVLITIVQTIHFDALGSVVFELDGLGFLLERAINTLGNALMEEYYKCVAEYVAILIFAGLMLLNAEFGKLNASVASNLGCIVVDGSSVFGVGHMITCPPHS